MAEPLSPKALEALHNLDLSGSPAHVVSAYQALLGEVNLLGAALVEFEELGTDAYAEKLVEAMRLRSLEIRDGGFEMDITEASEMAAMYVAMARTMLGDAENYSETPFEFHVKIAEERTKYILTVQRTGAGKLTPHQARQRAEKERDEARSLARFLRLELIEEEGRDDIDQTIREVELDLGDEPLPGWLTGNEESRPCRFPTRP